MAKRTADPLDWRVKRDVAHQRDAFTATRQPKDTYLTTQELAEELAKLYMVNISYGQIHRWCQQWFGRLPQWRSNPKMGYRIPLKYRYVARAWVQTQDPHVRRAVVETLSREPKEWVVVMVTHHPEEQPGQEVAVTATTHYTLREASNRVELLMDRYERNHTSSPWERRNKQVVHVLNVGPMKTREDK